MTATVFILSTNKIPNASSALSCRNASISMVPHLREPSEGQPKTPAFLITGSECANGTDG